MSLRIVGGYLKGRRIESPKTFQVRPSSEMLRASLFNICQFQIENVHMLDLFSGSGALGIEALSRGAAFCLFVEKDRRVALNIQKNLDALELGSLGKVICGDAASSIKAIRGVFQLVTLDPPYDFSKEHPDRIEYALEQLVANHLLAKGALLFFEEGFSKEHLQDPPVFPSFAHQSSRRYGGSLLHHYLFESCETIK